MLGRFLGLFGIVLNTVLNMYHGSKVFGYVFGKIVFKGQWLILVDRLVFGSIFKHILNHKVIPFFK